MSLGDEVALCHRRPRRVGRAEGGARRSPSHEASLIAETGANYEISLN